MLSQTPVQFGSLLIGDRQRGGVRRDAVPELLGELDAFGVAQTQQIGSSGSHTTRVARGDSSRNGGCPGLTPKAQSHSASHHNLCGTPTGAQARSGLHRMSS